MPSIDIMMIKSILKITKPKKTPIKLKSTDIEMINGVDVELN